MDTDRFNLKAQRLSINDEMITGAQLSVPTAAGSVIQGDLCINQPEPKHRQFGKGEKNGRGDSLSNAVATSV